MTPKYKKGDILIPLTQDIKLEFGKEVVVSEIRGGTFCYRFRLPNREEDSWTRNYIENPDNFKLKKLKIKNWKKQILGE